MPKIAGFLALLFVLAQWGGVASAQTCEYAGQTFSLGSTVCECPNLRIVRSANSRGEARSRAEGSPAARAKAGSTPILSVWLLTPRPITPRTHSENFKRVIAHVFRSITPNCKKPSPKRRKGFSAWSRAAKCLSPSRPFAAGLPIYLNTAKR